MEIISRLIPLFVIISIIFSIINKAKQTQNKSSNASSSAGSSPKKSLSLQEIIRQQIEEQRNAMVGVKNQSVSPTPKPQPEPQKMGEGNITNLNSLENRPTEMQPHSHDAHLNKPYNEGEKLNRQTLEGVPTEMQRHAHKAHIGISYNEGDALDRYSLEGSPITEYEDKFDLDEVSKVSRADKKSTKPKKQALSRGEFRSLKINRVSVVNGIIMSEILNKRGGRRAL